MKAIPSSREHRHLARFSIFLITVALIVGIVGCGSDYVLTIRCKEGGQITSPVKSSSTYTAGTVINLTAEPEEGWRFDGWTGSVGTIADVNAAVTTITMNGTYSITAWFAQGQEIRDWFGLNATRTPENLSGHHRLMNDLDSATAGYNETASDTANEGSGWQPIGTSDAQFTGTFDGHGCEIRDLSIDRPEEKSGVGLFGYVAKGAFIKDIGLVNSIVTGQDNVGCLVGWNQGTVSNSYSSSNVTGTNSYVGGLVGWNDGTVTNSYSSSNVTGTNSYVGGLVGWNQDTVSNCYSSGKVTDSNEHVGGLVGWNQGTVSESRSSSNVAGNSEHAGGLVGWNDGTVSQSRSTGTVSSDLWIGGLVGWNDGTVSESYSTGTVDGDTWVGGLVGYNPSGTVSNCHSSGNVTGDNYVGGLVGWNERTVSESHSTGTVDGDTWVGGLVGWNRRTVSNSYSTGNVTGEDCVGGLVGDNHKGTVNNSYSTEGTITGDGRVGGLVGYNEEGSVINSYSTDNVIGTQYIGGLVGYNEGGSVDRSYSVGSVIGDEDCGGLVGLNNEGTVTNSFWDKDKATSGTRESPWGKGETTADMQDINTFLNAEWSICDVTPPQPGDGCTWNIFNDEDYPFLSWQLVS
jgi:hypothetical protein